MLAKIEQSCLDASDAKQLGFEAHPAGHLLPISPACLSGFSIPYFDLDGNMLSGVFRFRIFEPIPTKDGKPGQKYTQPKGINCGAYFPPLMGGNTWRQVAESPEMPVTITEGELKGACGTKHGLCTIALGGVWNWTSKTEENELIADLEEFVWEGRRVNIAFDSDSSKNPQVQMAASMLARVLADRGAVVYQVEIPMATDGSKQGIDDYIHAVSADAFEVLINEARALGKGAWLAQLNREYAFNISTKEVIHLASGRIDSVNEFINASERSRIYTEYVVLETQSGTQKKAVKRYAAKEWMEWTYKLGVKGVVFEPGGATPITAGGYYNAWRAWGCNPVEAKRGDVKPWLDLIDHLFDTCAPEVRLWVTQWFAYPLQFPGTKLKTALVICGGEGLGKSMLGETMVWIYGGFIPDVDMSVLNINEYANGYGTVTSDELQSNFNPYVKFKQFIVCNELSIDEKKKMANKLKDITVRPTVTINEKNVKQYTVADRANYFITSNEERPVHINEGDRRFFIHRVTSPKLSRAQFDAFVHWRDSEGGAAKLFYYLLHCVELGDFNPHGAPPITDDKRDLIDLGRTGLDAWAYTLLTNPDDILEPKTRSADLWTVRDLCKVYNTDRKFTVEIGAVTSALKRNGIPDVAGGYKGNNAIALDGARSRMVAIRNPTQYEGASLKQVQQLHDAQHGKKFTLQLDRSAMVDTKSEQKIARSSKFAAKDKSRPTVN